MRPRIYRNTIEFIWTVFALQCWAWVLPWTVVSTYSEIALQETIYCFFCKRVSITDNFLVRGESSCPCPLLSAGLTRTCAGCAGPACAASLCEFVCVSVLLLLEDTVFLESFITLPLIIFLSPSLHRSLISEGRGLLKTSHLGLRAQFPIVGLCFPNDGWTLIYRYSRVSFGASL